MKSGTIDFEKWLQQHGASVLLYARQLTNCQADAEDVFHDALVTFWQHEENLRDPLAYFYRMVRNQAFDTKRSAKRRQQREQTVFLRSQQNESATSEIIAEQNEQREQIEKQLQQLPIEQREIITLKHWSELTFQQISTVLEIPLRTAQSRYRSAIKEMQKTFAKI